MKLVTTSPTCERGWKRTLADASGWWKMNFNLLHIPTALLEAVIAHARTELPNECCGLLAGTVEHGVGRVSRHFAIRNDRASPTAYLTNARDLLDAMNVSRTEGIEVLAIFHSHPASAAIPSKTDLANNTWGETAMHVIVGLAGTEASVRGWWLGEKEFQEEEILVS